MTGRIFCEGFFLGLSTGAVCFASCAPFLVPYLMLDTRAKLKQNAALFIQFLAGRFLAYLLFGLFAGGLGFSLKPHLSGKIPAVTVMIAAGLMIFFALYRSFPENPFCRLAFGKRNVAHVPFLFGFLLGLNFCPPFLLGMARLIEIGSFFGGAVFFSGFFLSSTLYLLPLFAVAPFFPAERLRSVGTTVSLIVGGAYFVSGALSFF